MPVVDLPLQGQPKVNRLETFFWSRFIARKRRPVDLCRNESGHRQKHSPPRAVLPAALFFSWSVSVSPFRVRGQPPARKAWREPRLTGLTFG
jgi:hypothetical protein